MKLHVIEGYIQHIFLAEYEHGCLLLDGCSIADVPIIEKYFKQTLNRPLSDLKIVAVTHMHPDHAGAANKLRNMSNCKIATGTFDKHWYNGISGLLSHLIDVILAAWVAGRLGKKRRFIWFNPFLLPDFQLNDGESVPLFDDWQAIFTPGHTDRDISLFNETTGHLYVADLVVKVKGALAPPFPVYLPESYKHSLTKVAQLPAKILLMAHVPQMVFDAQSMIEVREKAPDKPKTKWNAIKGKIQRVLNRSTNR